MDCFRIVDCFHLSDGRTVYAVKPSKNANLCTDEIVYDLCGNRFKVKGYEIARFFLVDIPDEDRLYGILVEPLDGCDAQGYYFIKNPSDINFLFCNHPLYPRKVDEDYEKEYQVAGLNHTCALFSYEDMSIGKLSLYGDDITGLTIYRGWMMKPEMYKRLYVALEEKGIVLINNPEEYEKYHTLPGWYKDFSDETAYSVWTEGKRPEDAIALAAKLEPGPYIIKDYVKSRKHEWYDACFIPDIKDENFVRLTVNNFLERQGEDLVGGVVFRRFENLKKEGFHEKSGMPISEEYRAFVYAGNVIAINNYWKNETESGLSDKEYEWLESVAKRIKSSFVTVDIARKEDGSLIIMELGDGQVSGLQLIKEGDLYGSVTRLCHMGAEASI